MNIPIIRDKSHDPFIIYGGLLSRDLIEAELKSDARRNDSRALQVVRTYHAKASNNFASENLMRQEIADSLLAGVRCVLPDNSVRDIVYEKTVLEAKNAVEEWNLDAIRGSKKIGAGKRIETAEEELFRYLTDPKASEEWGVLTNGRNFRFYHRSTDVNYIEFDLFDIAKSGSVQHASLFISLIRDLGFRTSLFKKTIQIREEQIEQKLQERILAFLDVATGDRTHQMYSAIFFLTIRYLEDIGILPNNPGEYQRFTLRNKANYTRDNLSLVIDHFMNGFWFGGEIQEIFSDEEVQIFRDFIEKSANRKALIELVFDTSDKPLNLSDIYIDHLGNIYQVAISKHSEGAYYTPHSVGTKLATYLRQLNISQREKFSQDPSKVIIDPACGSGQLLRVLIPFSHYFQPSGHGYTPKNSLRRAFISKLVGLDKDPVSVFICKVGLGLMGAEAGKGLARPRLMKQEDTLEAFLDSRKNFAAIPREDIFAIITNPPWESLEFQLGNLYRKITGKTIPKKSTLNTKDVDKRSEAERQCRDFDIWVKKNGQVIEQEQNRIRQLTKICDDIAEEHKEYFTGKKNLALYFIFIINKLLERSNGSYIVVMPDRFFVGEGCPVRDRLFKEFEAYVPFQDCGRIFEGVDNGTRFGIIFGRKGVSKPSLEVDIPIIEDGIPKDFVSAKVSKIDLRVHAALLPDEASYILPFFKSQKDIELLSKWMAGRQPLTSWQQGRINLGARGEGSPEDYGKVGDADKYPYRVVKSTGRKKASDETLLGTYDVEFGCTVQSLPKRLERHYQSEKLIAPNVKRNGIRKIIAGVSSDCLVEHDYNFSDELGERDLPWVRTLAYNHICSFLAGSYHLNASLMNFVGKPTFKVEAQSHWVDSEIYVLEELGFSLQESVHLLCTSLLDGYPEQFITSAYTYISTEYAVQFSELTIEELLVEFSIPKKQVKAKLKSVTFNDDPIGRVNIAAYIINELADEPTFGRTKLEKLLYLFDVKNIYPIGGTYERMAAGPLDVSALYDKSSGIEALGVQFGVFSVKTKSLRSGGNKIEYGRGPEIESARENAVKVLRKNGTTEVAEQLIALFRRMNTEQAEIVATVYAAWSDILGSGKPANPKLIVAEVRQKWHKKKERFSPSRLEQAITWMISKGLVPGGPGKKSA